MLEATSPTKEQEQLQSAFLATLGCTVRVLVSLNHLGYAEQGTSVRRVLPQQLQTNVLSRNTALVGQEQLETVRAECTRTKWGSTIAKCAQQATTAKEGSKSSARQALTVREVERNLLIIDQSANEVFDNLEDDVN